MKREIKGIITLVIMLCAIITLVVKLTQKK